MKAICPYQYNLDHDHMVWYTSGMTPENGQCEKGQWSLDCENKFPSRNCYKFMSSQHNVMLPCSMWIYQGTRASE